MNKNLQNEGLDALLHSGRQSTDQHAVEELNQLRAALADLRKAGTAFASAEWHILEARSVQQRRNRGMAAGRLAAAAGLAAAAVLTVGLSARRARPAAPAATVPAGLYQQRPAAVSDDVLLNSIGNDLAGTVPEAMRPLAAHGYGRPNSTRVTRKD